MSVERIRGLRDSYRRELLEDCLPFWIRHGRDEQYGGIYTSLARDGKRYCTDKSVWLNGRCGWMYAYAYDLYGKREDFKQMADSAMTFLTEHCIDPADGRMYFMTTAEGRPLRKRRYYFSETFYTLACAEYARAMGSEQYLLQARKYFNLALSIYRDPTNDPYKITPKTIPGSRDTQALSPSMIMLNTAQVMHRCDPDNAGRYQAVAAEVADNIFANFYKEDMKAMLEQVGPGGAFMPDVYGGRTVNPGHIQEAAWFLLEYAQMSGDETLLPKIENLYDWSLELGWDREYGGIYYFVDILGAPPEQLEHDMKLWWPISEALISSALLYEHTGKQKYFDWFLKLDDYATKHFRDPEFGDWYGYLHRDGSPTLPACKGNMFKGPFHLPRMLSVVEQSLGRMAEKSEKQR